MFYIYYHKYEFYKNTLGIKKNDLLKIFYSINNRKVQ